MRLLVLLSFFTLASCGSSGGGEILRYEVKTIDSAVLQQILIAENSVSYFIFLPHENKAVEGKLTLGSDKTMKIRRLIENTESTTCKHEVFADDQIIEIEFNSKKIVCRESALHSYPQVSKLVSEFRSLTQHILKRLER